MTHAVITEEMQQQEQARLDAHRAALRWQRCVDRWMAKHYWEGEMRWLGQYAAKRGMTPYAAALDGCKLSWTSESIKHWTKLSNLAWAEMTWDEKIHEPVVWDHHFKEIKP